jgi:hypothetical protein
MRPPSRFVSLLPAYPIPARLAWRASAVFHKESTNKMDYDPIPVYVQDDEYAAYETLM